MRLDEIVLLEKPSFNLSIIKTECSEFLANSDSYNTPLYRGLKGKIRPPSEVPIRTDRKALHTNPLGTAIFNLCIEMKYKLPVIRSRVAFATTSFDEAAQYGKVYYLFPKNGTKALYNPTFPDSIAIMSRLYQSVRKSIEDSDLSPEIAGKCWTMINDAAMKTEGNMRVDDISKFPSPCKEVFVKALQEEVVYNEYISGYKHSEIGSIDLVSQHRGAEYMLYNSPSYYIISRDYLAQMAAEDLGEEPEGLLHISSSSDVDALYEYLQDLIDDGATI